jgi:RNA polymerase sigma-70 factor (ECF subfamily)
MWFFWMMAEDERDEADETLMQRFNRGDSRALGVLYDRHAGRLKAFAIRQGAARPDDIVQEAFLRVVRTGSSFKGDSRFKTWLYSITRNLCIDAARRGRFRDMPSLDQPLRVDGERTLGDTIRHSAPASDASRATADGEFRRAFDSALGALPAEQREVFVLREFSGLRFAEIAEVVGCNENTVKSRMRYALLSLREALQDHC